jgi:hypothetical protein
MEHNSERRKPGRPRREIDQNGHVTCSSCGKKKHLREMTKTATKDWWSDPVTGQKWGRPGSYCLDCYSTKYGPKEVVAKAAEADSSPQNFWDRVAPGLQAKADGLIEPPAGPKPYVASNPFTDGTYERVREEFGD